MHDLAFQQETMTDTLEIGMKYQNLRKNSTFHQLMFILLPKLNMSHSRQEEATENGMGIYIPL